MHLIDLAPRTDDLLEQCLAGLRQSPRQLPCKIFYDQRGSQLFDRICDLPEYYPTRTEMAIMRRHIDAMAAAVGPDALLIELGSGSSLKTRILLDHLHQPAGYVPIDISREHLLDAAEQLAQRHPDLPILPVCADYLQPFDVPTPAGRRVRRRVVYFPGSTIGNFHRDDAQRFLARIAQLVGPGGGLLIGVDLRKEPAILLPAYNDTQGVTAAFNLNLLHRINREAGGDFDVDRFRHRAVWNDALSRIEMHLVSLDEQTVHLGGETFPFAAGESIRTECSYKYTLDGFADLASEHFTVEHVWTDPDRWFSVQWLRAVAALVRGWSRLKRVPPATGPTVAAVILLALGGYTWALGWSYQDEETLWRDTLVKNPDAYTGLTYLGSLERQRGRLDRAYEHFARAVQVDPDAPEARRGLANVMRDLGRFDEALPHYEVALQPWQMRPLVLLDLAEGHYAHGQYVEAARRLEESLEETPSFVPAMHLLAWIYATAPDPAARDGEAALRWARRASEAYDHSAFALLDALAAASAEAGRFDDAIRWTQRAMAIYQQAGRLAAARTLAERLALYEAGQPYRTTAFASP